MVDCGATALFIGEKFVKKNNIRTYRLQREIPLFNIDGSNNRAGKIARFASLWLRVGDVEEWREFLMTDLGPEDVVLGLPWLRSVNPTIDWAEGTIKLDSERGKGREHHGSQVEKVAANRMQRRRWWKSGILDDLSGTVWCAAGFTYSTELVARAGKEKRERTFDDIVPKEYRQYAKVFSEVESERLPDHKSYDHAIDLKPETPETLRSKVYPMPLNEQEELDHFLNDNL
jgi:hypothetical protein